MTPSITSDNGSSPTQRVFDKNDDALKDELYALQCAQREYCGFTGFRKGVRHRHLPSWYVLTLSRFLKAQAELLGQSEKACAVPFGDNAHHGEEGLRIKFDKAKDLMLWQEYMQTPRDERKDLPELMEMTTLQFDVRYVRTKREYITLLDSESFA